MGRLCQGPTEGVPFVDLNEISGQKPDSYSHWKEKYHFHRDRIHTSYYGAQLNAHSAAESIYYSLDPLLRPLQAMMQNVELPVYDVKREEGKPVVFITGDSTVKNVDRDKDGMWGWVSQAGMIFDDTKITYTNVAVSGRSARNYIRERRWEKVYNSLQPGDFAPAIRAQRHQPQERAWRNPRHQGHLPRVQDGERRALRAGLQLRLVPEEDD